MVLQTGQKRPAADRLTSRSTQTQSAPRSNKQNKIRVFLLTWPEAAERGPNQKNPKILKEKRVNTNKNVLLRFKQSKESGCFQ